MPVSLLLLMEEWKRRLAGLRERLSEDPRDGQAWMLRIHARILLYLMGRYAAEPERSAPGGVGSESEMPTYCVVEPRDCPPRPRTEMGPLLRDVRRINAQKRGRWRWGI